jgi:hypothetical protein
VLLVAMLAIAVALLARIEPVNAAGYGRDREGQVSFLRPLYKIKCAVLSV